MKSISAAKSKKRERVSARPRKSSIERFLSSADIEESTRKLFRETATIWEELALTLETEEGPRAIQYGERVNQSLKYMGVQQWLADQTDKLNSARQYRKFRTSPFARQLLDRIILENLSTEEIYGQMYGAEQPVKKLRMVALRTEILAALRAFAALIRFPGAH